MNPGILGEVEIRYDLIDPALKMAGWNLSDRAQIQFEVPVHGYDASTQSGLQIIVCIAQMVNYLL